MTGPSGVTGVLLVGHGSRREEANDILRSVAARVAERLPSYLVQPAFLEIGSPTVGEGFAQLVAAGCTDITVIPYFLYPGNHTARDIPAQVAEAAERHPSTTVRITGSLDVDDRLVDLVVDRVTGSSS